MPTYISLLKYTEQGIRNIKDAPARVEQASARLAESNARIIGTWWTQGAYDAVVVTEFPDDETASAAALTLGIQGNVRTETMRAYTADEMQRIIQKLP